VTVQIVSGHGMRIRAGPPTGSRRGARRYRLEVRYRF
jgi:hypothetical protein